MPKILSLSAIASVAVFGALVAVPGAAGAQATANEQGFCAARESVGPDSGRARMAAGLRAIADTAPDAAATPAATLLALFEKKGMKIFDGDKAFGYLDEIDASYFDVCAVTKVDVTATDFAYDGVPAVVPAGRAAIRLANTAAAEPHEMTMVKLTPAGEAKDPFDLLALSDKKIAKFIDFSTVAHAFADPGETGYGLVELEPGTYLYGCFVHEGGTKNGTPHYEHGMWGTFTVE